MKFLKNDPDEGYARVAENRFFVEAESTHSFGQLTGSFVKYNCWGAIDARTDGHLPDTWVRFFGDRIYERVNIGEEYTTILESYYLQGPFYTIELCQATLYDLLDRNTPWLELPVYRWQPPRAKEFPSYSETLITTAQNLGESINWVIHHYIDGDLYRKSGYDILNSFSTNVEANHVRNYAVLELFDRIVSIVRSLHSHPRKLTHRDLKPGDVFLAHDANFDGIGTIGVKLGDLGFSAELMQLRSSFPFAHGIQNPSALASGSQFYRAPEQAESPIEVRVSYDRNIPDRVWVYNGKINNIQVGDWLVIGDLFMNTKRSQRHLSDDLENQTVFKIVEVLKADYSSIGLVLDRYLMIDKTEDIWAQVVHATGYHTDGYSLGAILYDLASGGRNPEHFYTYCLVRFIEEFSARKYSIDEIVEALAPQTSLLGTQYSTGTHQPQEGEHQTQHTPAPAIRNETSRHARSAKSHPSVAPTDQQLEFRERAQLAWQIFQNTNIENLLNLLLDSSLGTRVVQRTDAMLSLSDQLTFQDKWEILKVVMGADSVDELISMILQSPLDVRMSLLRSVDEPSTIGAPSIAEKWDLLRLVMNANDAHGVLDLIFSPSLEHIIKKEHWLLPGQTSDSITSLRKKWDYLKIVMQSDDIENLIEDIIRSALNPREQVDDRLYRQEWLRNYRFRSFHIVNELLTDRRGVPIPAYMIKIIVKCMLRNIEVGAEKSYYSSRPGDGFLGEENIRAVERIRHDTQVCLKQARHQLPRDFPEDLEEDLLFKLRSMAPTPQSLAPVPTPQSLAPVKSKSIMQPRLEIFLCHVNEDRERVLNLRRELHNLQLNTWEFGQIKPGEKWQRSIQKHIEKADIFIACLSHNFVNKQSYAQQEIEYALQIAEKLPEEQIYIIPLRLDECVVPDKLSKWQWFDYFDGSAPEQLVHVLRARADEVASTKDRPQLLTAVSSSQKRQNERVVIDPTEIDHLKKLLNTHRSALAVLQTQVAVFGEAHAPVDKLLEITAREESVRRIKWRLRASGILYTDTYMDGSDSSKVES